ncbi:MAG: molybdopterin biosynthesis protein [Chloroflexi bacterium]|nr:molybdopterin biosynthesis protein [Chloroflexota bacterium]
MTGRQGHQRRYYLSDIPLEEARDRFHTALRQAGALEPRTAENVPLAQARGRVTAGPVWAVASSPHYDAAAMDGIAVRAADTTGATETAPVSLTVGGTAIGTAIGTVSDAETSNAAAGGGEPQAVWVNTGDPMPAGLDAVIMIENLHQVGDDHVSIMAPVAPWQHVRPLGEDIVATELVLPENHRLAAADLGACAAAGLSRVPVRRRPRVTIIPTGNELVPVGSELKPGDIIEFNSLMLSGLLEEWGAAPSVTPPVPDVFTAIRDAAIAALDSSDLVVINAGSSAGSEDYTALVVEELGQLLVHGVAIRPGHPVVLGVARDKPLVGIPGYPVSAMLTAELLLKPLIEQWLGQAGSSRRPVVHANITRKVVSPTGEDEFLRVKLGRVGEKMVATPVQRGAGVIMSLVRADGMVRIPRFSEGLDAGSDVDVELLRPLSEVENTVVAIGSHDLTLDLMSSFLRRLPAGLSPPSVNLSSSHVGSLGGLIALRRGEAHLAGSHLLDEDTGEYNVSYIRRYLGDVPVALVNLVGRVQGLIVRPGNPMGIAALSDLLRRDISFVNRQRGSGTRVLLDYKLKELGASPQELRGYEREEYSHLAVAAAVNGGSADVGLGILSAARALGLDFIPLLNEQYDLVIPLVHYESDLLRPLLDLLANPEFRKAVNDLGGYDTTNMGRLQEKIG